jgi:hypothetical protein
VVEGLAGLDAAAELVPALRRLVHERKVVVLRGFGARSAAASA